MKSLRTVSIAISLLLAGALTFGQDADWNRSISVGDEAMSKHQYSEAETAYREGLKVAEQHWKKDPRVSASLIKLAESCNAQSKKDEAESLANRSVASLEVALKAHKPKDLEDEFQQAEGSASLLDKAGDIFDANEKYPDAETLYRKVIALREKYATADRSPAKPSDEDFMRFFLKNVTRARVKVADVDDKLANLYLRERKFPEATVLYGRSEVLREKEFGHDQPPVANSLYNLATCHSLQGQYDQAEPLYKRAIAILERSSYKDDPRTATILENYALLLKKTAREAEAKDVLERASAIRAKLATVPQ